MKRADLLCILLRFSGALAVRSRLLRLRSGRALVILAYHRIVEEMPRDFPFDEGVLSCTRREFEREMAFVKRGFDVVSFADLERGGVEADRPLIITFDDGYKDNYTLALPILEQQGLKATFFITTGYVDNRQPPWWDEIAWIVKHARAESIVIRLPEKREMILPLGNERDKRAAIGQLLREAKSVANAERQDLLNQLRAQAEQPDAGAFRALMMSWDEVRDLAARGMEVGSHTVSHPVLGRMEDPELIMRELVESKRRLELATGRPVLAISYPVGRASQVSDMVTTLAEHAGYCFGCVYEHGVNPKPLKDRLRLKRVKAEVGADFTRFRAKVLFPRWVRY